MTREQQWKDAYEAKVQELARETERVSILAQAIMAENHSPNAGHVARFRSCGLCEALRKAIGGVPIPTGDIGGGR